MAACESSRTTSARPSATRATPVMGSVPSCLRERSGASGGTAAIPTRRPIGTPAPSRAARLITLNEGWRLLAGDGDLDSIRASSREALEGLRSIGDAYGVASGLDQ